MSSIYFIFIIQLEFVYNMYIFKKQSIFKEIENGYFKNYFLLPTSDLANVPVKYIGHLDGLKTLIKDEK